MADHTHPDPTTTISETFSLQESETKTADGGGLRSLHGIRWLLLAGALVSAVSLYRLVESQWELIPVAGQYLVLVIGALALAAMGELAHRRLHLPLAGSALMLLFSVLVPVLSWGAAYLDLLHQTFGRSAFIVGTLALLLTARRPLGLMLSYRGRLFPAILAVFMLAQPVLPELAGRHPDLAALLYLAAAVGLGALLQIGSRHINRFFFHRDRSDGVERPVEWMPFAVLAVLYLGAMVLLDPRSELMALPLAVIGMVLADTGEEYYRALARSRGEKPEKWPKRSLALMAIGISAIVVALPLSFTDPSLRCSALVSICAAVFFGRWSLRSPGDPIPPRGPRVGLGGLPLLPRARSRSGEAALGSVAPRPRSVAGQSPRDQHRRPRFSAHPHRLVRSPPQKRCLRKVARHPRRDRRHLPLVAERPGHPRPC